MTRVVYRIVPWLVLALLAGCGHVPQTHYYTLSAPPPESALAADPKAPSLGVGPVGLPPILDHAGIVSQPDATRVTVSTYHLWAGDLTDIVTHVVAERLADLSGNERVEAFPWDNRVRPEYQLKIQLETFAGAIDGLVHLRAVWTLTSDQGQHERLHKRAQFERDSWGGYAGYVSTLNGLLLEMADAIHRDMAAHLTAP